MILVISFNTINIRESDVVQADFSTTGAEMKPNCGSGVAKTAGISLAVPMPA
jgi:hypothetical protein